MVARPWTPEEDEYLRGHFSRPHDEIGAVLGRSRQAVRNRCWRLGFVRERLWAVDELSRLRALYACGPGAPLDLTGFARSIGRDRANVCRKARELGLVTDPHRRHSAAHRAANGERTRRYLAERGHPRGALGLRHTPEARARIAEASRAQWRRDKADRSGLMSPEQRQRLSDLMSRRQHDDPQLRQGFSRSAAGYRDDLPGMYFRSAWEANVARYLNFLMAQGQIHRWEYEPDTFWFEPIKRGVRSYKPDFKIWDTPDGEPYYWEVKGWDYARGRTARQRMAKYHPRVRLELIDEDAYNGIKTWAALIPGWETQRRSRRLTIRTDE